jgi:2-dehydropantoate 2-reductase
MCLRDALLTGVSCSGSMNPSSVLSGGVGNAAMSLDEETRQHLRGCMIEVLETAPKVLGRPFPAKLATADAILKSSER